MSDTADIQHFLAHSDWLKELARGIVHDPDRAEDVVQETWLKALEKPPQTLESPRGWLHRVALNAARGVGRSEGARKRREDSVRVSPEVRPADEVVERAQTHALLAREVLGLDEPYRSTVLLRYFEGMAINAIAKEHAVTPSTVRSRIQRALAELRHRCERSLGPDTAKQGGLLVLAKWCQEPTPAATSASALGSWGAWALAAALVGVATLGIQLRSSSSKVPGDTPQGETASLVASTPLSTSTPSNESSHQHAVDQAGNARSEANAFDANAPGRVTEVACQHVLDFDRPAANTEVNLRVRVVPSWLDDEIGALPIPERTRESRNQLRLAWSRKPNSENQGTAQTNASGGFALPFDLPKPDSAELLLVRAEVDQDETWRASRLDLVLRAGEGIEELRSHLEVRRSAHGFLSGRVLTTHGAPIPNAKIRFRGQKLGGNQPSEAVATTSADDGTFRLGPLRSYGQLELEHADYVAFDHDFMTRREEGGWEDSDLYVVPSGQLRVRVVRQQEPVANAVVRVWTDVRSVRSGDRTRVFRETGWNGPRTGTQGTPVEGRTGKDGWAELSNVWVGKRLRVEVEADGVKRSGARVIDNTIVFDKSESFANPIALANREPLELNAVLLEDTLVRGRVLSSTGTVVGEARVNCYSIVRESQPSGDLKLHAKTDSEGRFELLFPGEHSTDRFLVVVTAVPQSASTGVGGGLQGLGYLGGPSVSQAEPPETGHIELIPSERAQDKEQEVEIRLGKAAAISGTAFLSDGSIAHGRVVASAHDCPGLPIVQSEFDEGRFELLGLRAESYDLRFEQLAGEEGMPIAVTHLPDVEAGSKDLRVEFDIPGRAEVQVQLDGPALGVLLYRWAPEEANATTPPLARQCVVSKPSLASSSDFQYTVDGQVPLHGEQVTLPPLPAGRLQLVLLAHDKEMEPFYWSILGPFAIQPGPYKVEFGLLPTGGLRGRVPSAEEPASSIEGLVLVNESGQPLVLGAGRHWLQSTRQFESGILPVDPDGSFAIPYAAAGKWRLRFGSFEELSRGAFTTEHKVEVKAGTTLGVELE